MSFVSLSFIFFLAALFVVYFLSPQKYRWIVLLVASLVFFLLCSLKSIFFILFATISTYLFGIAIARNKEKEKFYLENNKDIEIEQKKEYKKKNKKIRKTYMVLGILALVVVLVIMKYLNFLIGNINNIIGWFSKSVSIRTVKLITVLGLSYYTFQAIGYLADVYWGKYPAEKNFFKFLLYMCYFPKIMQGPITRYNEMSTSLFAGNSFNYDAFTDGLKRMLWGFFKKVVIADCLKVFTTFAFANPMNLGGFETVLAIICYFICDYCDFSAYMDIACGVSTSLGIKLPENFNHPYFAVGIDDYWRRWHMTLGAWFKDYIFYPLSISKFSLSLGKKSKKIFKKHANKVPAIFGLIIVWFLTGLWHGASWNYIFWGLYFGLIIILSIIFEPIFDYIYQKLKIDKNNIWLKIFRHIRTLILLAIGKVFFETNSISAAFQFLGRMFVFKNYFRVADIESTLGGISIIVALVFSIAVFVVDLIQELRPKTTFIEKTKKWPIYVQWLTFIALIVVVVWFGYYGSGLPKFEFGYMGF